MCEEEEKDKYRVEIDVCKNVQQKYFDTLEEARAYFDSSVFNYDRECRSTSWGIVCYIFLYSCVDGTDDHEMDSWYYTNYGDDIECRDEDDSECRDEDENEE